MADRAAARPPRRARRRQHGVLGAALIAGAAALGAPAQAQTPFFGDSVLGTPGGGIGRPASPFQSPLLPGQAEPPRFWQAESLPDIGLGRPPAGAPPQPWSLRPSLEIQGAWTDNVLNSATDRRSDFYTSIIPAVTVAADTVNLVGALTYAPRARFYMENTSQNRVDQLLRGQGLATLVQDRLFLEFSAFADVQSVLGEFTGLGAAPDADNNEVQTTSYRISPYFVHRFGDFAEARIGYAFRQVIQSGDDAFADGSTVPFFTSTDYISHQGYATLSSGDSWGRFGWTASLSATEFDGDGVYDGAYNRVYGVQLRYAITREIAALVDGGWQQSFYNGRTPFEVDEPIWSVGMRYAPDETSFLTVRYGQYDGQTSWFARGGLDLGVRTRLFVDYSERLSNSGLQTGDALASLRVDALGNLVDNGTGVPAALAFGSPLQSVQSGIFRSRRASVAVSQAWLRDTLSLGFTREEREPVAIAAGTTAFAQDTNSVSLGWTHQLQPGMTLNTAGRFGLTESEGQSQRQNYGVTAALARALSPTLFATLRYEFSSREVSAQSGRSERNTVILALRQAF